MLKTVIRCFSILLLIVNSPGISLADDSAWQPIQSLFDSRCVACHSTKDAPLGLQLNSYEGAMQGSVNGPIVVAGDPAGSELVRRITGRSKPGMPLAGEPLSETEIALIADWISAGAVPPEEEYRTAMAAQTDPRADGRITYAEVQPIFARNCIECHSDNSRYPAPPEGLRLDSLSAILGGHEHLVLVPGNPQASEIIRRVKGIAQPKMPLDGDWLNDDQIALLTEWIAGGALNDEGQPAPVPAGARLRIRGTVTGSNEIDGVRYTTTGQTDIRDRLSVGDKAEVRVRITSDGALTATRIKER